jgi:hypothetical protein
MKTAWMIVVTAVLGLSGIASAQDKPCMADAARLCAGIEPGGGAQMECLKSHKDELSPACKKKVLQAKIKHMENQELQKQQNEQPEQPMPQP